VGIGPQALEPILIGAPDVMLGAAGSPGDHNAAIEPVQLDVGRAEPANTAPVDDYATRLLKYIPAEIITLYVTLEGIVRASEASGNPHSYAGWLWIIFLVGLVATPLYLSRVTHVKNRKQILISTLSYVIWVLAVGQPFRTLGMPPLVGALALPIFTFAVAVIQPDGKVASPARDPA
jgi:hypothetical protein